MDDLIRRFRDYQIEWLTAHNDIEFCEEEEKLIIGFLKDTAESFMRENQSAQQWIPCSERLPEKSGKYLVSCKANAYSNITTAAHWQSRYKHWDMTGARSHWRVDAWMPLPEPYKGDDNG